MSELERRDYEVAMSVEALASAWARTENAPAGAVVVAAREISGRLRGGVPWTLADQDALSMAIVVRPAIAPLQEALLWVGASHAAAAALSAITGAEHGVVWPDRVATSAKDKPVGFINVAVQLSPGAIDHAVVTIRLDMRTFTSAPDGQALIAAFAHEVSDAIAALEQDAVALLATFNDSCLIMGESVRVELLPRGEARGRATAVDGDGFLVLESTTGMLERIAPASLRSLDRLVASPGEPA